MLRGDPKTKTNDLSFHTGCKAQTERICFRTQVPQLHCFTTALIARWRLQNTCKCRRGLNRPKGRITDK